MSASSGPIVIATSVAPAARAASRAPASPAVGGRTAPALLALIGAAWLVAILAQLSGNAGLLHHHALIEGGPPLLIAVPLFLLSWQVMVVAMMLPASVPAVRLVSGSGGHLARSGLAGSGRLAGLAFLVAFALAWTVFGLAAFAGDDVLHHIVDATPWLDARPFLIEGGVLALAGLYQFLPIKRQSLAACRHPASIAAAPVMGGSVVPEGGPLGRRRGSFVLGLDHGFACLGSSWALMLLVFAEGFANLWWMVALTALMVYEATGRHGYRAASMAGFALLVLAGLTAVSGALA